MQKLLIGMAVAFVAAAALGITLDELNVARDPENLDETDFVVTPFDTVLRSAPGEGFPVLRSIPKGSNVPIIACIASRENKGLWVRTWVGARRGWAYVPEGFRPYLKRGLNGPVIYIEPEVGRLGFRPIGRNDDPDVYAGPGFEYNKMGSAPFAGPILFIEGSWVLTESFQGYTWLYVGTDREPAVHLYKYVVRPFERECPLPSDLDSDTIDVGLYMAVKIDSWPKRSEIYLELHAPLGRVFFERAKVDDVEVYQPPQSKNPLNSGAPNQSVAWSTHEVPRLTYGIGLPNGFEWEEPFRAVARMHYEGAQDFEMEFLCNADE